MDLLELIRDKCSPFSDTDISEGLNSVITHIEIAESHFEKGKLGDEYLFTDVIYRCNQAFEGSLKEAYKVFVGKDVSRITPYQIEQYFEKNGILKERVLSLFSNYREEWRNKSTHDYRLYFTSQEAFLALISICAFFNILLEEMLEKKAYDREKEEFSTYRVIPSISPKEQMLFEEVTQILIAFSKKLSSELKDEENATFIRESEILGSLSAYLSSVDSNLEIITDYLLSPQSNRMRADIFIKNDRSSLLVEIKRLGGNISRKLSDSKLQLLSYMHASGINDGIIYIPPIKHDDKMIVNEVEGLDSNLKIVEIYPEFS